MNLLTGLFRAARKRVMTTDNDMGMFRTKLEELVASKDTLSDEDVVKKVEELKGYTSDLPGDEDKAKLDRFLEDFKSIKEQDEATAKEAAGMVADLFEKLDTEAMKDVPAAEEAPAEETPAETTEPAPTEETVTTEEIAEETEVPPAAEAEDADPNPEYSLEEIYQFCKKRREEDEAASAADASACDSAEEVEEEKEEEEKETVTDHAPHLSVTMNGTSATGGGLNDLFSKIKGGR